MTRNETSTIQDAWLADFADQILDGDCDDLPASVMDPGMLSLAETLLRLKRAFPKQELEPTRAKRLQARIMERWQEEKPRMPRWVEAFWQNWFAPSRRQTGMALAVITIASLLILAAPLLFSNGIPLPAAAGFKGISTAVVLIVLGLLAAAIGWLLRRKP